MDLFATDFDGTLKQNGLISRKTMNEIKRFRENGNKFGIVTGRTLDLMAPELKIHNIPLDFLVGANGGIIQVAGQVMQHSFIEFSIVEQILALAHNKKIANVGVSDGYVYGNIYSRPAFSIIELVKYVGYISKRANGKKVLENKKITTMFLHDSEEKIAEIYSLIKDIDGVEAYVNNLVYLDVVAKDVSKANAVAVLESYFKADNVYVIVDSMNDYPMIERYHGFCVANACAEIKEIASASFKEVGDALSYVMEVSERE